MKKVAKKSPMKKMMTGGKNPLNTGADGISLNATGVRNRPAGSPKGTMVGLNKAATVESSAGNPKLSYKKGGSAKTKMMYGGMKKMGKKK